MYELFEMADSGNCYKVRLTLHQLDIAYRRIPTDILRNANRTEGFLALNPNGKVPLLVLPDGRPLAESNAILAFLAEDTPLLAPRGYSRALALQWLFFEQYSHERFIATNRFWIHIAKEPEKFAAEIQANETNGYRALEVMDGHLTRHSFFVDDYSIADIALYAYTHVADEGGFNLERFPHIRAWLTRVASQPRHIRIDE